MPIKQVKFIFSQPDVSSCPKTSLPEYAFIGRSNVGKSSLINMLANNNKLAKTSSTPGKTRLINYFLVDNAWYIVDLPGYGFAKISKKERERLSNIITGYISKRENMVCLFVLIDIRHKPLDADLTFMENLGVLGIPFSIVFTKSDKIPKHTIEQTVSDYLEVMKKDWENLPSWFVTSSSKGEGKDSIIAYIEDINKKVI